LNGIEYYDEVSYGGVLVELDDSGTIRNAC
jgi:hypothetical protein